MSNRYKFLASNTLLYFLNNFSSKILVFLMTPIYTAALSTEEYGSVSLMMTTANLLIPMVSLGISNSIIRFGLDKKYSKKTVFTTGVITLGSGFLILLCLFPLLNKVDFIHKYIWFLYLFLLMSCSRTLVQQFSRAKNYARLYAFDGIISTFNTMALMILFLVKFKMGPIGYILAIITADGISTLFLSVMISAPKYFSLKALNKQVAKEMLSYCLPLIPASVFWWITNASDRYLVKYLISESATGIYDISYKIPYIINVLSTTFTEAWQISAVQESGEKHTRRFFTNVFKAYQSVVFIGGAGLILLCKPLIFLLAHESYFEAWQYVPCLILATIFSCLAVFLSSIYMVEKRGGLNLATMMAGAFANVGLNLILIPKIGVQGAAIATFISYLLVFVLRAINTKKFIDMNISPLHLTVNLVLLISMSCIMVAQVKNYIPLCVLFTLFVIAFNAKPLITFTVQIFKSFKKNRKAQ